MEGMADVKAEEWRGKMKEERRLENVREGVVGGHDKEKWCARKSHSE